MIAGGVHFLAWEMMVWSDPYDRLPTNGIFVMAGLDEFDWNKPQGDGDGQLPFLVFIETAAGATVHPPPTN